MCRDVACSSRSAPPALIGFPGLRMAVGEDEQRMGVPKAVRKSAYEDAMFTMKGQKGGDHGHRP